MTFLAVYLKAESALYPLSTERAMQYTVYEIRSCLDGRRYIGATANLQRRIHTHRSYARTGRKVGHPLYDAMRAQGVERFEAVALQVTEGFEAAQAAEADWIARLDTQDPQKGFNLAPGGAEDYAYRAALAVEKRKEVQSQDPEAFTRGLSERARKAHARKTPEERSELARQRDARMSAEALSQRGKSGAAAVSKEAHKRGAAKRAAMRTPEEHAVIMAGLRAARKAKSAMRTPEERSALAARAWAGKTPEQRREIHRKRLETMRRKAEAKSAE